MQTRTGKCKWSEEEDKFIEKNHYNETDEELGIHLGRTAKSVAMRKYRLKNKKPVERKISHPEVSIYETSGNNYVNGIAADFDARITALEEAIKNLYCINKNCKHDKNNPMPDEIRWLLSIEH